MTARRRRGVVLPPSPDGRRGARLCPSATRLAAEMTTTPLALEDQLVLRHGFVPADRPAPLPTMRTRMTASKERQRRQLPAT